MTIKHAVSFAVVLATSVPALAQGIQPPVPPPPGPIAPPPVMTLMPPPVPPIPPSTSLPMLSPPMSMPVMAMPSLLTPPMAVGPMDLFYGGQSFDRAERERYLQDRETERRQRDREREETLYEQATDLIYQGRYDKAIAALNRLVEMKGTRADAALYWKAHAENRIGQRAEALSTLAEFKKTYPNSRYMKSASALEIEVRGAAGQPVRPETQADEDLKLMAIQAMQNVDPEQAVPRLEQVLNGSASPRVKERALYVLALTNTARARDVLKNLAKGSSTPELQMRAIQYLGVHGGQESRSALAEVYASSTDVDVKKRILRSFMTSGDKTRLFSAAQTEQNPELRNEAVRQLGVMGTGAHEELWQLYQKESSPEVKKQIIQGMYVGGNAQRLIDLAKSERDADLRRTAIRSLGVMGTKRTGDALVEIYTAEKDATNKKTVIGALFTQNNAAALVAIARKEQDVEMKKEIVQRLANMHDKVAVDYMLELLNK